MSIDSKLPQDHKWNWDQGYVMERALHNIHGYVMESQWEVDKNLQVIRRVTLGMSIEWRTVDSLMEWVLNWCFLVTNLNIDKIFDEYTGGKDLVWRCGRSLVGT